MSSKAKWMWHAGDYEVYHHLLLQSRRTELGFDYPSMWHTASPYKTVQFTKTVYCPEDTVVTAYTNGKGYIMVDWQQCKMGVPIEVQKGDHNITIRVTKPDGLPCVYVDNDFFPSDDSWDVTHMTVDRFKAECTPAYTSLDMTPETFPFSYQRIDAVKIEKVEGGILYDFGKEMFGQLKISNITQPLKLFFGESIEEALDTENTIIVGDVPNVPEYTHPSSAFRFVYIKGGTEALNVYADYEYLPLEYKGNFKCSNDLICKIWDTAAYTFHLNSREFFLDGIKRDRWVWSGDAYQSYMVNNYLFFDKDITRRTIIALRGKDPVEQHINTILDYSFYWILSIYDYYNTYNDLSLAKLLYPKMVSLMDFTMNRVDEHGFVSKHPGDWIFIDWSDIDKNGPLCAEQMLYYKSLETMHKISELLDKPNDMYIKKANDIKEKIDKFFWSEEKGAYIDTFASGKNHVTRHANIFAIMFDIADADRQQIILKNVLENDSITQITTPYFKFFELDALCKLNKLQATTDLIHSYWGGMIKLGATSIWETFDPNESGIEHYGMYGKKYGKSLCHAWGGGPIYLLGRYYLGVYPTSPGYETFTVSPNLGGLTDISGTVPIYGGKVDVYMDSEVLKVSATKDGGTLDFNGNKYTLKKDEELVINL